KINRKPGGLPVNNEEMLMTDKGKLKTQIILLLLCTSMLMISLNCTIVSVALPSVAQTYHIHADVTSWIILSYLLVLCSTLIIFGRLADRTSPKWIFVGGTILFGLSAFVSGTVSSLEEIFIARLFQGLGAAMMISVGGIIIRQVLPETSTGRNLGLMTGANAIGYVIGPPLGGFLCGYLTWQWVFLINAPIAAVCALAASVVIPDRKKQAMIKQGFDITGAAIFFGAVATLVFLISYADHLFRTPGIFMGILIATTMCWILFIHHEKKTPFPLIDLSLFSFTGFSLAMVVCLLNAQMDAGSVFVYPFYLEIGKDLTAFSSGMTLLIFAMGMGIIGFLYGRFITKLCPRIISILASVLLTGSFTLALISLGTSGLLMIGIAIFVGGASIGLLTTANNHIIINLTPKGHEGVIWGMIMTTSGLGSVTGVAVFSLLLSFFVGDIDTMDDLHVGVLSFSIGGFSVLFIYGIIVSVLLVLVNYLLNERKNGVYDEEIPGTR
ncbi:MAG: MFS transporter, partial [Methanospirillum sp.]|nr:MFS transporter [Methanospirillum sp.]